MKPYVPVVAIDGPAGAGKTTVGAGVARELGYHLLISGMLYRALAYQLSHDMGENEAGEVDERRVGAAIHGMDISFDAGSRSPRVTLNGVDMTARLAGEDCAQYASRLAVHPEVRAGLSDKMRSLRCAPGLVAEGRDMGTVVFSDARVKIYLDAPHSVRMTRRYNQLKESGIGGKLQRSDQRSVRSVNQGLMDRDQRDVSRAVAPLRIAEDARVIDTTDRTAASIVAEVVGWVNSDRTRR